MFRHGLLNGMKSFGRRCDSFDRLDGAARGLHREYQTRSHRKAINENGARSANAVFAPDMRSGQPKLMTKEIGKVHATFGRCRMDTSVDIQGYGVEVSHAAHSHADELS